MDWGGLILLPIASISKRRTKRWTGVADRPFRQWMIASGDRGHRKRYATEGDCVVLNRMRKTGVLLRRAVYVTVTLATMLSDFGKGDKSN